MSEDYPEIFTVPPRGHASKENVQNLEPISAGWSPASLSAALRLSQRSRGDDVRFYHVPMIFPIRGSGAVAMTKALLNWS